MSGAWARAATTSSACGPARATCPRPAIATRQRRRWPRAIPSTRRTAAFRALRAAIAGYYERLCGVRLDDERIAATCAGMNAVMLVAQAIVEPGDNVVCVTPSWPNILRAITITGGEAREVALDHDDSGWHLDLQRLFDACDGRTRAIYYASPGNPTGWMLEDAQQRELLAAGAASPSSPTRSTSASSTTAPTRRPSWKSPRRTTPCSWSTASPSPGP